MADKITRTSVLTKIKNVNLFFTFGSVKDGGNYYSNAVYVPAGYKIADGSTLPTDARLTNDGDYYYLITNSSSLAGKGTNIICNLAEGDK